jgi:enediyne biosynthesis protein E4
LCCASFITVAWTRNSVFNFSLLIALTMLLAGCGPSESSATIKSRAVAPWFADVTIASGLDFVHDSGASGAYFMPESIGSGAALIDFDNDGRLDIYLIHGAGPTEKSRNRLYHQGADGRFIDVSEGSGLDVSGYGMGAAVGDVNNDGWPDLLVTEYGAARLFRNLGTGKFAEITAPAGIENTRWAAGAAFFDYDRDGWLDLVIVNYVDYAPTQKCYDTRGVPEYCGPQGMAGTVTKLFHNLGGSAASTGDVRFADVTVSSGLAQKIGPGLAVVCADFNGDRWPDIFIADDGQPNRLFINQQNGRFAEEAALRGLAYNALGNTAANMGIALGDVDGDASFDIFVTHLAWEQHALWKQGPRGVFQEQAAVAGLVNPGWRGTGFGTVLADFDHDGALDLVFVNGSIKRREEPASTVSGLKPFWSRYAQRNQLFANDGSGKFRDISAANSEFCGHAGVGRGLAYGDFENDGALDLLATCTDGPARIFRNTAPQRGHWLMLRAVEPAHGGRDAYGAEITIEAGGRRWWRLLQPGSSYLVSNDSRIHIGLGPLTATDRIRVLWPDGTEETFPGGAVDRLLVLAKGAGSRP